jgi:hypothetical protein
VAYKNALRPSKVPGKKAGPNGSFPVGDPKHARLAIGGATRSFNAGHISKATEDHIKTEARAELPSMHAHADQVHPVKR